MMNIALCSLESYLLLFLSSPICAEAREAATFLGYTKKMWDKDKEPAITNKDWEELTKEQQDAFGVLGYNEQNWEEEK